MIQLSDMIQLSKEDLGRKIRELRSKNNKSQEELGVFLHKSHAAVSDIERGKTELSFSDLNKIAEFFDVPAETLLYSQQSQTPYYAGTFYQHRVDRGMKSEDKEKMQKAREEFIKKAREQSEEK